MKKLVKKMSSLGLLRFEFITGTLIMAAACIVLPVGVFSVDPALMENPYILMTVAVGMLMFGLVGFFGFIRPYCLYRKLPEVQAYTDGEFLYIRSKKQAKIPLAALEEATVRVELPYLFQKEFLYEFVLHLFSEKYGSILLEVPKYGKYRLYFVPRVKETAGELYRFLRDSMQQSDWIESSNRSNVTESVNQPDVTESANRSDVTESTNRSDVTESENQLNPTASEG